MCSVLRRCCPPRRPTLWMSKADARYRRRIIMGVLALAGMMWLATDQFGVPRENMAWFLVYTLVAVLCIILLAAVVVALWIGLRKLLESLRAP